MPRAGQPRAVQRYKAWVRDDEAPLTGRIVVPPSLASVATACLAELHGRIGHFPAVVRLRPRPNSMPTVFDVAEVINLQLVRDAARKTR